jgi:hypothetical protein
MPGDTPPDNQRMDILRPLIGVDLIFLEMPNLQSQDS